MSVGMPWGDMIRQWKKIFSVTSVRTCTEDSRWCNLSKTLRKGQKRSFEWLTSEIRIHWFESYNQRSNREEDLSCWSLTSISRHRIYRVERQKRSRMVSLRNGDECVRWRGWSRMTDESQINKRAQCRDKHWAVPREIIRRSAPKNRFKSAENYSNRTEKRTRSMNESSMGNDRVTNREDEQISHKWSRTMFIHLRQTLPTLKICDEETEEIHKERVIVEFVLFLDMIGKVSNRFDQRSQRIRTTKKRTNWNSGNQNISSKSNNIDKEPSSIKNSFIKVRDVFTFHGSLSLSIGHKYKRKTYTTGWGSEVSQREEICSFIRYPWIFRLSIETKQMTIILPEVVALSFLFLRRNVFSSKKNHVSFRSNDTFADLFLCCFLLSIRQLLITGATKTRTARWISMLPQFCLHCQSEKQEVQHRWWKKSLGNPKKRSIFSSVWSRRCQQINLNRVTRWEQGIELVSSERRFPGAWHKMIVASFSLTKQILIFNG